eukprot:GGOE01063446.1.p5 GENE.GGOE01063446.1~~GGOE01063446.1.p5  ORF type:complete len:129 (+),score=6.19 GGOE01063446.1:125-511(+)
MEKVPGPVGGEEPESRHVPADIQERAALQSKLANKTGAVPVQGGKGGNGRGEVQSKASPGWRERKGRDGKNTLTCHPIEGKVQGNIVDCTVQPSTLGGELTTGGQRPGEGTGWLSPTCKTRGANACTG